MNKNYIWVFNAAALASGIKGTFSLEYHIPGSKMKVHPEQLVGSRVWLIVRDSSESFLYAMLTPSSIELYQEGKYKDDFLMRCEPFASARFLPRQESLKPWRTSYTQDEDIRECPSDESAVLAALVHANKRVGFAPPAHAVIDIVPKTVFTDLEHAVPDQLTLALRSVSYGDVSRFRSLPASISAFGGVALTILSATHPHLSQTDVVNLLATIDPMVKDEQEGLMKSPKDILAALSLLPPAVDTFLEEIELEKISPRTFVARTQYSSLDWLDKTSDSERAHEQILKDMVIYLKDRGFKVYKSRSFDLFAEKSGSKFLCEIKSANSSNSVSQGEKGIVQLLRYSSALADNGVRFMLILQANAQPAVHTYLSKMADRAGSEFWLYDAGRDWPKRLHGIDDSLFPES